MTNTTAPGGADYLRLCSGCNGALVTSDPTSQHVWCNPCRQRHVTPYDKWAAALKPGDTVYVQPCFAWRGLSRSRYLIVDRDGDTLTVQVLGIPESRMDVQVSHCGEHDLTPRTI